MEEGRWGAVGVNCHSMEDSGRKKTGWQMARRQWLLVGLGLYRKIENQLFFLSVESNGENAYHLHYLGNKRQK